MASYGQIFRVIPHLPGSANENIRRIWDLHRRHAQEVISVVDRELRAHASIGSALERPTNSLLTMISSPIAKQPDYIDPIEVEATASEQATVDKFDYTVDRIAFAVDDKAGQLLFEGGLEFGGSVYELIAALAPEFEGDIEAGTDKQHYRFVQAPVLAKRLAMQEPSLRQSISRARQKIEQGFLSKFDRQLDANDVIENKGWNGYRLNPHLLGVKPAQLREQSSAVSQVGLPDVTSRPVDL